MSEETINGCITHKDRRHIRLYYDYLDIYKGNEHKAKIIRILETWTDSKREAWYKFALEQKEQGITLEEPDFWITMSYQQFRHFMRETVSVDTIKGNLAELLKAKHIERRVNPDNPYGPPQYKLNCAAVQKTINKLPTSSFIPDLPLLEEDTPPGEKTPPPGNFTPPPGVDLPPPQGGNVSPPQGGKTATSNNNDNITSQNNEEDSFASRYRDDADLSENMEEEPVNENTAQPVHPTGVPHPGHDHNARDVQDSRPGAPGDHRSPAVQSAHGGSAVRRQQQVKPGENDNRSQLSTSNVDKSVQQQMLVAPVSSKPSARREKKAVESEPTPEELAFTARCKGWYDRLTDWCGSPMTRRGQVINEHKSIKLACQKYSDKQLEAIFKYLTEKDWKYSKIDNKYTVRGYVLWDESGRVAQILREERQGKCAAPPTRDRRMPPPMPTREQLLQEVY